MLGWSIRASAWRSWSKRASIRSESRPGRTTLTATRRCTGAAWSATQTSPMPPSPSFWRSLKRPAKTRSGKSGGPLSRGASVGPASGPRSRMPPICPSASSRRSMRRRSASSLPQASSRNARRSAPGALPARRRRSTRHSSHQPFPRTDRGYTDRVLNSRLLRQRRGVPDADPSVMRGADQAAAVGYKPNAIDIV